MTLFLPKTFPLDHQATRDYTFGHNNTHMALSLDYGSLMNHHESANVRSGHQLGSDAMQFQVHRSFRFAIHNVSKKLQHI